MEMCKGRKGSGRKEQEEDDKERKEGAEDARPIRGNRWGNTGEGSIGEQREPCGVARLATVTAHLTQKTQCVMETDTPSHAFQHN